MSEFTVKNNQAQSSQLLPASQVMSAQEPLKQGGDKEALQGISIQRKLSIGSVNDPLEDEADAMADKVMRMPERPFVQRKCAHCEEEKTIQRSPLAASITPFIQAKGGDGGTASNTVTQQINATRGSGSSMDRPTQSFMESRFGTGFSNVKIHTGDYAVQMSRELNAQAFTVGNNIYFNSGKYNPSSESGKHLLAHELTHTVQQGGTQAGMVQRAEIDDDPANCTGLADVTPMLDAHVNAVLAAASSIANGADRVQAVYNALGGGVQFSHIEDWCEALPATHQHRMRIEESRYSTTFYGSRSGSGWINPWWMKGERTMGTLINVGGLCIGSDKLGHFFQQGRDYFHIADTLGMGDSYATGFGQWLEGIMPSDPAVAAWITQMNDQSWPGFARLSFGQTFWQGVYGLSTTGVFSNADLEANRNGMEFYRRVFASPSVTFSAAAYINGQWNERQNPGCYGPQIARLVAAHDPGFLRIYRETMTRMVEENPYSVNAYSGMGVFESLIQPYISRYTCQ
jgi:Domain of unknown function (DUF4157)